MAEESFPLRWAGAVLRPGTGDPLAGAGDVPTLSRPGTDSGVSDVGMEAALLDRDGVIESVNQAWLAFAEANGGDPARTGPGAPYLEACAAAGDDPVAQLVAESIRAALDGKLPGPLVVKVPCHSPAAERWYEMLICSRTGSEGQNLGAAVTLSLARARLYSRMGAGLRLVSNPGGAGTGRQDQRVPGSDGRDRAACSPNRSVGVVTAGVTAATTEAFADGVALADHHGMLLLTNRRLEEMFGYQHGELRGQPVEQLIPAHLQDAHRRHRAGHGQAPATRPMGAGARLVGLRKDGSTFPAEISLSPVQAVTGQVNTLTIVRDVTAARRLEELAVLAAAPVAARGSGLLGYITANLHHVGLILDNAAELHDEGARQQIAEAMSRLDVSISAIRAATLTTRDENI